MVNFAKMVEIVRFAFSTGNWCEASSDSESSMFGVRGEVFSNFLYLQSTGAASELRGATMRSVAGFAFPRSRSVAGFASSKTDMDSEPGEGNNAKRCGFGVFQTDLESEPGERNNVKRCGFGVFQTDLESEPESATMRSVAKLKLCVQFRFPNLEPW
jgi:hypothetical protein